MILRKLEINDYYNGILNLLSQLTICNDISFESFYKQYLNMGTNYHIYVIEEDSSIVGFGCLYLDYKFYRNCSSVGHIEDIIVDKNYRGKGYAKIIINKLIEIAKNDCYKVILSCTDEYIHFYGKFGLKNDGNNMILYL